MGAGGAGVKGEGGGARSAGEDRGAELQRDIERIRNDLARTIGELDRRRHALTDVKGQLRRHAGPAAIVAVAVLGLAAGAIALGVARRRRRNELGARMARLREALGRMMEKPSRVANDPGVGRKIAAAAGAAAASALAKRVMARGLDRRSASSPRAARPAQSKRSFT
jgi:hypothetical protein